MKILIRWKHLIEHFHVIQQFLILFSMLLIDGQVVNANLISIQIQIRISNDSSTS